MKNMFLHTPHVARNWRLLAALLAAAFLSDAIGRAQTVPSAASPKVNAETMKALRGEKKKKTKTANGTAAGSKESALAAIVTSHQKAAEAKRRELHGQVEALLKDIPTDPAKLLEWHKQLQAALDAERAAVEKEDAALRSEVDKAAKRPGEGSNQ